MVLNINYGDTPEGKGQSGKLPFCKTLNSRQKFIQQETISFECFMCVFLVLNMLELWAITVNSA